MGKIIGQYAAVAFRLVGLLLGFVLDMVRRVFVFWIDSPVRTSSIYKELLFVILPVCFLLV